MLPVAAQRALAYWLLELLLAAADECDGTDARGCSQHRASAREPTSGAVLVYRSPRRENRAVLVGDVLVASCSPSLRS